VCASAGRRIDPEVGVSVDQAWSDPLAPCVNHPIVVVKLGSFLTHVRNLTVGHRDAAPWEDIAGGGHDCGPDEEDLVCLSLGFALYWLQTASLFGSETGRLRLLFRALGSPRRKPESA
jgi:hypothetical protein